MILDIYKDSFEYASKKVPNLLLLGVLSFLNFLIIPFIFFMGYNYRVVKQSAESMINVDDVPPEFSNLSGMFVDGLKYFVVQLVYLIIPIIILVFSLYNDFNAILFVVGLILLLICSLFAYLAIPHMASNYDSLSSAFSIFELNEIMSSIGYGRYILTYIGIALISVAVVFVVLAILIIVFGILGVATVFALSSGESAVSFISTIVINVILSFIVLPYLSLFQSRCVGLIYNLRS